MQARQHDTPSPTQRARAAHEHAGMTVRASISTHVMACRPDGAAGISRHTRGTRTQSAGNGVAGRVPNRSKTKRGNAIVIHVTSIGLMLQQCRYQRSCHHSGALKRLAVCSFRLAWERLRWRRQRVKERCSPAVVGSIRCCLARQQVQCHIQVSVETRNHQRCCAKAVRVVDSTQHLVAVGLAHLPRPGLELEGVRTCAHQQGQNHKHSLTHTTQTPTHTRHTCTMIEHSTQSRSPTKKSVMPVRAIVISTACKSSCDACGFRAARKHLHAFNEW